MRLRPIVFAAAVALCLPVTVIGEKERPCLTADEASNLVDKDVCVTAHVYNVVQLEDGTRYLDVCSPDTPDAQCRFTIVSYWSDRDTVGQLERYRDADVKIRGNVRAMHGRAGLVLSHERQFRGGPAKFRPNPRLLHGFSADESRPAISDPNLRAHGAARSFMDRRQQTRLPAK